ncbi:membrane protein [Streptomyces sp. NRRL F-2747]|uniref:membrane protein n=1 Tax=Streptomyces sp. NRRL F-2747 TaxID=1463843 RepID=UPI0004C67E97|nr:membrane protein [Streptomyces sp. NRRL F-2747]
MHMNSAPHLLTEDRPEFDRLLDEALRTAHERPELAALGERLNAEQLRTMAIGASALLTAAAAAEYDHYVKLRGDRRDEVLSTPGAAGDQAAGLQGEGEDGAGVSAVVAVLAPVLAGTAMVIFLLVGYVLKAIEPEPAFAKTMLTAGWLFGALTVVSLLFAVIGLLVTAVRNRATEVVAEDEADAIPDDLARAREAWRHALLERGILPFLRDALADPSAAPAGTAYPAPHTPKAGRIPNLGYSRPDFTSPGSPSQGPRPGYTPPDFTSPDFTGPDGGTQ